MSLTQKLVLYALAIALIPVAATGFTLIRVGEDALRARIASHQASVATSIARHISQSVEELITRMASVLEQWDPMALDENERRGLLLALYRLSPDVAATMLLTTQGIALAAPVDASQLASPPDEMAAHPSLLPSSLTQLATFTRQAGKEGPKPGTTILSPVRYPENGPARLTGVIPLMAGSGEVLLFAFEIALRPETLELTQLRDDATTSIFLVDDAGRVIHHPRHRPGYEMGSTPPVKDFLIVSNAGTLNFARDDDRWLAAFAPVGALHWSVFVEQPHSSAFASVAAMRRQTLGGIALTLIVVLATALIFAGVLRKAIVRLVAGARTFSKGKLDHRIRVNRSDEIGELSDTMNAMAQELADSLHELEGWAQTLEVRVEERTAELKSAQSQLLLQSKLAAVGQLGAGVAHEINNPLATIKGMSQLLLEHPQNADPRRLQKIVAATDRCQAIVARLLRFSERRLEDNTVVGLNDLADDVLALLGGRFQEKRIEAVRHFDAKNPSVMGDYAQLSLVLVNLLNNAIQAMENGGTLTITTSSRDDRASFSVEDTGVGIDEEMIPHLFDPFYTTKNEWRSVGLGLSIAYRVVEDHGGSIHVNTKRGHGTQMQVSLPTVSQRAQPGEAEAPQSR